MKISHITFHACFIFVIMQFFISTEMLVAQNTSSDNNSSVNSTSAKKPNLLFEQPDFHFGTVYKGRKVEHVFKFKNQGDSTLEIKKVKPSCGCTAAVLSNGTILPGKTGEIKTTFNSGNYEGNVKKTIAVISNDPDTPSYKLTISGEIVEVLSIKPRNINFGSFRSDNQSDKTVKISIKSLSEPDFKITKISSSKPFVAASTSVDAEGGYTITATLKNYNKIGRFSGKILLDTNSVKQPEASIVFYGVIEGDITINQKRVYFGTVPDGREVIRKLYVKINKSDIKVLSTKISPDYLSIKVNERYEQSNPHCLIEIVLNKEAPVGKIDGLLELGTNSKEKPLIKIPITGEVHKADSP